MANNDILDEFIDENEEAIKSYNRFIKMIFRLALFISLLDTFIILISSKNFRTLELRVQSTLVFLYFAIPAISFILGLLGGFIPNNSLPFRKKWFKSTLVIIVFLYLITLILVLIGNLSR